MTKPKGGGTRGAGDGTNIGNAKPISLYPLTPEEALRRAMATPPPPKAGRDAPAEGPSRKPKAKEAKRS